MSGKVEAIVMAILSKLKIDMTDYCDLETVDGNTIVGTDGSMASVIEFHGTKSVMGRKQFEEMVGLIERSLATYFRSKGHQLQIIFRKDLDASETLQTNALAQHATAERLGLAVGDLIDEGVEKYAQYVYDESCYLVLWTRPCLLDPIETKMSRDEVLKIRMETKCPSMKDSQNLLRPIRFLADRHHSFVSKICDDLSSPEFNCSVEQMNVGDMLRTIRKSVLPDYTSPKWQAAYPGTRIPKRWKVNADAGDGSELLYPSLPSQIMASQAEIGARSNKVLPDPCSVRVGSRVYAPLLMQIPPSEPSVFNNLFNALNRAETIERGRTRALPYVVSFMLESDGMSVLGFRTIMANVLSWTSQANANINLAAKELSERTRDGECVVKFRVSAMTWANNDAEGIRELTLRKSKLWKTLEGWGGGKVIEKSGNPLEAFQSCAVGLTWKHIANPAPAPLGDAIAMLPLTRPASPFHNGSINYRSLDGKLLRYQRFSSEQTTWITLISGKPGSGKSVLMNNNNVESCLMPGATRLPYVCIIDVGVSSSGFIDLIRDNLPEDQKHLAVYKRLQNKVEFCINTLDTPLGQRIPLPKDRAFAVNFLATLATPPERKGKPYEGMSSFIGRIVDGVYLKKSDKYERSTPERLKGGHDPVVESGLAKLGLTVDTAPRTYWEVVDLFFKNGLFYEAEVAQRYAVPVLNDLIEFASSPEIHEEYGDAKSENGMSLINAFRTGIREAIANFPIFSSHTRFDLGSARIMSLDLQDVAMIGSDAATKQTALMYMVARQSFMKRIAFSKEDLPYFDLGYRPYYERLINEITEDYKVLCMDEYHKTGGHELLKQQVFTDGREARKWNLEIVLASQLMEDFGNLVEIATSFFILDSGTESTRRWLRQNVGLNEVAESALQNYVHGAGPHGSTFLARFVTKSDTYVQLFTMTAGPMRLWALSTTAEDRKLRSLLYAALPGNEARALLAEKFPSGSCKRLVDKLKAEKASNADHEFIPDDDASASIIDQIAKAMIDEYFGGQLVAA